MCISVCFLLKALVLNTHLYTQKMSERIETMTTLGNWDNFFFSQNYVQFTFFPKKKAFIIFHVKISFLLSFSLKKKVFPHTHLPLAAAIPKYRGFDKLPVSTGSLLLFSFLSEWPQPPVVFRLNRPQVICIGLEGIRAQPPLSSYSHGKKN